jgi:hypothetical protein
MRRFGVVLSAALLMACEDAPVVEIAPKDAAAEPNAEPDVADTTSALRRYWASGQAIEQAGRTADACGADMKFYSPVRGCYAKARDEIAARKARMPRDLLASGPCGRDIEDVHRRHAADRLANATLMLDWLDAHREELRRLMTGRTVRDACELPGAPCGDKPAAGADLYKPVRDLACLDQVLVCEHSSTPCVYQIAAALGMSSDLPVKPGPIMSRDNGDVVR